MPADIPERLLGALADYAKAPGHTTDTVERILDRPALSYARWASENSAAFTGAVHQPSSPRERGPARRPYSPSPGSPGGPRI